MRYVCEFYKEVEVLLFFFLLCKNNSYNVKDFKYPGQRTRGDSDCPIGVSSSRLISIPLFCSVSGLKMK